MSALAGGVSSLQDIKPKCRSWFRAPRRTRARVEAAKKDCPPAQQTSAAQAYKPNPVWFKPVMFGLMIIGLLWIITFYISSAAFPVAAWGSWNIVAGFGIAI